MARPNLTRIDGHLADALRDLEGVRTHIGVDETSPHDLDTARLALTRAIAAVGFARCQVRDDAVRTYSDLT